MSLQNICQDKDQRRRDIRAHLGAGQTPDLNGLDYLEVEDDQLHLRVYFLGKAPKNLAVGNFRIDGGVRIKNIKVVGLQRCATDDPFLDDCMTLEVDKAGDFSTYTLRLVEADEYGRPTEQPLLTGFDQRYLSLDFSFKVNCPSDLDCKVPDDCPPDVLLEPDISYLAKDYATFRQLILDRMALLMPDWKERHAPDLNIALVEILAYVGDHLSYYQDAVATEAYLDTARQRISVRRHARLVDYSLHEGNNSRAWLFLETSIPRVLNPANFYFITGQKLPLGTTSRVISEDDLREIPGDDYEVFEAMPTAPFGVYPDHNAITIYTWGERECCLPRGTTSATLLGQLVEHTDDAPPPPALPAPRKSRRQATQTRYDEEGNEGDEGGDETPSVPQIHLKVGDFVLFEEVLGAKSGAAADTDLSHRQVVRLTKVEAGYDNLYERAVVEIEWAEEDALPFALCLSAIAPLSDPPCQYIENISVARANLILVDNGRREVQDLDPVPGVPGEPTCECQDEISDTSTTTGRFRPWLKKGPLTFRQPLPTDSDTRRYPATGLLSQNPRYALPVINLSQTNPPPGPASPVDDKLDAQTIKERRAELKAELAEALLWQPQADLLASGRLDHHYVVEIDDFGRAHLRFGDGELGYAPAPGTTLSATYRIGNGPSGNVGAETISHLVQRNVEPLPGSLIPRNPLAAVGGALPQPVAEAKLLAPQAFKATLERAIIPADYARLTQENFPTKIQRATANLRWTGSWYEMQVAIDPFGRETAEQALLDEVLGRLYRYRRIGHDLVIKPARYVPLDIKLQICVKPDYLRGHVKAVLQNVLSNRRLPDGTLGFFHPDRLSFGENLYLSKLVAAVGAVEGVESVDVTKLQRLNESADGEIENGLLPLGSLQVAQLDNDPNYPEHGRLILDMRGGR